MARKLKPIHPGEILREEFMKPLGLNPNRLSIALRVPAPTVYEIVNEKRSISPEMALRLARYFNVGPDFWLNLQTRHDLEVARDREAKKVEREIEPLKVATADERKRGDTWRGECLSRLGAAGYDTRDTPTQLAKFGGKRP